MSKVERLANETMRLDELDKLTILSLLGSSLFLLLVTEPKVLKLLGDLLEERHDGRLRDGVKPDKCCRIERGGGKEVDEKIESQEEERPGSVYIMEKGPEEQKGKVCATRAVINSRQDFLAAADSA